MCDAAGSTRMRRAAPRYIARSRPLTAPAAGVRSIMRGTRSVSGESTPMRLRGIPCHSCTTNAPVTAYRFTSPKPWVTTITRARAVRQRPCSERFGTARMPRAAASVASCFDPTSQTAVSPCSAATSQRARAPSPMPTAQPKTHSSRVRGTRIVKMRPAAYSGTVASFRALPAPKEKDAIPRAYLRARMGTR